MIRKLAVGLLLLAACTGADKRETASEPAPSTRPQGIRAESTGSGAVTPPGGAESDSLRSRAVRVGGDVTSPRVKKRVEPVLPPEPATPYRLGNLLIEGVVDESGKLREIKVLNQPASKRTAAYVAALEAWEFEPGTRNGEPVPVVFNLTVNHFPIEPAP